MSVIDPKRICILTLVIGADYRRSLAKALDSKRAYAARHGYTYVELGEEWWDRTRPLAWSKVPAWIHYSGLVGEYDYIWISDADVYITNPALRLEDHVLPYMPAGKELMLTYDVCAHLNTGNMIVRPGAWAVDFWRRVWAEESCINHQWWENAAVVKILGQALERDLEAVEVCMKSWVFNAYIQGLPGRRLWLPGDFLVHYAGVYDAVLMARLMEDMDAGRVPRLNMWNPKEPPTFLSPQEVEKLKDGPDS